MPLSAIGAGWGRTGTYSLKLALEQLGLGPCHHMRVLIDDPAQAEPWAQAARGEEVDWGAIFEGFGSAVDWPSCDYYRELAACFPKAKIILTERDPESWFKSTQDTIFSDMNTHMAKDPSALGQVMRALGGAQMRGQYRNREACIAAFEAHNAEVRASIPSDRLLIYRISDGWERLCRFLDVRMPAADFPLANTTEHWRTRRSEIAAARKQ